MILTRLTGGLGNQLFQYACGRALAEKNQDTLLLDVSGYGAAPTSTLPIFEHTTHRTFGLSHFAITAEVAPPAQVQKTKYPYGLISKAIRFLRQKIGKKYYIDYHPEILSIQSVGRNIYLDGYFQSEAYFASIRPLLLTELRLSTKLSPAAEKWVEKLSATTNSVSLHVRRGDYANDPKTLAVHGLTPLSYYHEAIAVMRSKFPDCEFFIFSDEISWARDTFSTEANVHFVSSPDLTEYEELHLMTLCAHNIIANSTFSWWGAWLGTNANKIVIAPRKWTNTVPDDHPNILPSTWTKL